LTVLFLALTVLFVTLTLLFLALTVLFVALTVLSGIDCRICAEFAGEVQSLMRQLLSAMAFCHERRIVRTRTPQPSTLNPQPST